MLLFIFAKLYRGCLDFSCVCVMPVLYGLVWSLQKHYITQLRILILGHLQNAMRNENKPKCYCIFELMGYI